MLISSAPPATACASLVALRGDGVVARALRGGGLAALILVLLARLFGRTEAAWQGFPEEIAAVAPRGIIVPAVGRAPHAACIEAGLVPDWILPGIRNRGMRPGAVPARLRRRARPVRAPPLLCAIPR
jgi:hypothetical protein